MAGDNAAPQGPDLAQGVPAAAVPEGGSLLGRFGEARVLLVRHRGRVTGVGATCTHWGGPLDQGLVVGGTVRCPWHHACFDARSGALLGGPAQDALPRWTVVERAGTVKVTGPAPAVRVGPRPAGGASGGGPESVVIVGAGGAGTVAAAELRRLGYERPVTVVDPDPDASVDRPNLSKDYLAGKAPEEWIPLRPSAWWREHDITRVRQEVRDLDPRARTLTLVDGTELRYGAAILATGAEPVRVPLPGDGPPVCTLRSLADARRIAAAATRAKRAAVIGASFIGLEVAASLRERALEVHVIAPEVRPLERVLGPAVGDFVRSLHEARGVIFHLERTAARREAGGLVLSDGSTVAADLIVMGVGVRPRVALAERAGLTVENGVVVDGYLETSAPGVFAVGDIARYPERRTGSTARIEHWAVAQRQARTAARNALGLGERYAAVPFFWSQHYDVPINYVGYAPGWDAVAIEGSLADRDAVVWYRRGDVTLAQATVYRDAASLAFEAELEAELGVPERRGERLFAPAV